MRPIAAGREPSLIQLDAAARPGPPTDFIYNDWYPALRTDTLREPVTTTLLNIPLLLGRKRDNSLFALRDLCPHRGIPLSAGWFDGETVQCKYHGWRFEPCSGRCEEIPSLTTHDNLEPTKIFANAFPVAERDGYAWVYIPAPGAGRIIPSKSSTNSHPSPPSQNSRQRFRTAHLSADLPCNVDHGIIGLMDPAHGPFVHQAWWWRSAASIHEKTKRFEPINSSDGAHDGFRMSPHAPSSNSAPYKLLGRPVTTIDFTLPNRRVETIVAENPRDKSKPPAGSPPSPPSRPSHPPPAASTSSPPGTSPTTSPSSRLWSSSSAPVLWNKISRRWSSKPAASAPTPASCSSTTPTSPPSGTSPSSSAASPAPAPTPSPAPSNCTGEADPPQTSRSFLCRRREPWRSFASSASKAL